MKSQSAARLRSIGFGLHTTLSRMRSARPFRLPARIWISRASQLWTAARPALVSLSRTTRLWRRAWPTFVSLVGVGSSKVVEVAFTFRPARCLAGSRTRRPRLRIFVWVAPTTLTRLPPRRLP
jgi:hypothetical protein